MKNFEIKCLKFSEARETLIKALSCPYEPALDAVCTRAGMYSYYDALDGTMRWIVYVRYEK